MGIGAPGVANPRTGVIEFAPNLTDWVGVPLGARLEKAFGVPVVVENDVNAGAYGEATVGAAAGYRSMVGIFPGTGIGGGIVLDGKLLRGAHNGAGEIGHVVVLIDGPRCGCGRRGCIEALASRTAIERDILGERRGGRQSIITKLIDLDGDEAQISSGQLASALQAHDALVTDVIKRAAHHLGIFTAGMINVSIRVRRLRRRIDEACGDDAAHHPRDDVSLPDPPAEPEKLPILKRPWEIMQYVMAMLARGRAVSGVSRGSPFPALESR